MGNESGSPMKVMTDVSKADPFNWKCVFATDVVTIRDYSEDLNTTQTRHALTNSGSTINNDFANFYGSSRDFDGSNDVINGPNSDDFKFGWEDFTVEAWVKTGQTGSYAPIVGRWTCSSNCCLGFEKLQPIMEIEFLLCSEIMVKVFLNR